MAMLRVKRILRYSSSVIDVSLEIPIKKIARIWLWQLLLLGRRLPFLLLDRWMVGWCSRTWAVVVGIQLHSCRKNRMTGLVEAIQVVR